MSVLVEFYVWRDKIKNIYFFDFFDWLHYSHILLFTHIIEVCFSCERMRASCGVLWGGERKYFWCMVFSGLDSVWSEHCR